MAAAYNRYGVANYSAEHRLVFDGMYNIVTWYSPEANCQNVP